MIQTRTKQESGGQGGRPRPGRASWSGELKLGSLLVPVKAYMTIQNSSGTQLCQVHAGCGNRIEQPRRCPKHGALEPDQIGKAFPYSPNHLIELTPADLESLTPTDEKKIVLERFFDRDSLDLVMITGRSLQLAPSHAAATGSYAAVVEGLSKTRKWAFGHVVFSGKRHLIVVRPESRRLILHTLHHPQQLLASVVVTIGDHDVPPNIAKQIRQSIRRSAGQIAWDEIRDDTSQRLAAIVQRRKRGSQPTNRPTKTRSKKPSQRESRRHRTARAA